MQLLLPQPLTSIPYPGAQSHSNQAYSVKLTKLISHGTSEATEQGL